MLVETIGEHHPQCENSSCSVLCPTFPWWNDSPSLISYEDDVLCNEGTLTEGSIVNGKLDCFIAILIQPSIQQLHSGTRKVRSKETSLSIYQQEVALF